MAPVKHSNLNFISNLPILFVVVICRSPSVRSSRFEIDELRTGHEITRLLAFQREFEIATRETGMLAHDEFGAFTLMCLESHAGHSGDDPAQR